MKRTWETIEPPAGIVKVARKRTRDFADAALLLAKINDGTGDFLDTLMISCYLQGIADVVEMRSTRTEGDYENER